MGLAGNWTYCQFFETFQEPRTGGYFVLNFKKDSEPGFHFFNFQILKKTSGLEVITKSKNHPTLLRTLLFCRQDILMHIKVPSNCYMRKILQVLTAAQNMERT